MKTAHLILLLFTFNIAASQENLVPNPGFEKFFDCEYNIVQDVIEDIIPAWNTRLGRPRYFNSECPNLFVEGLPHDAFSGNGFIALSTLSNTDEIKRSTRNYMQVFLNSPLEAERDYYVEYYITLTFEDEYIHSGHGVHFTNEYVNNTNNSDVNANPPILLNPLVEESIISILNHGKWVRVQQCFVADSNYQVMIIGNFAQKDSIQIIMPTISNIGNTNRTSYDNFFLAEIEQEVRLDDYDDRICAGDCITLSTNHSLIDGVFEWKLPGSNLQSSGDSTVTVCYNQAGVYDVHLDVQHCTGEYSGDFPQAITVIRGIDFEPTAIVQICAEDSFIFSIPDSLNVLWADGSTEKERELGTPGVYEYTLDNGACSKSFSFELLQEPSAEIIANEIVACQGDEISFEGQIVSESSTFIDTLTSNSGCDSIYEMNIFDFYEDIPFEIEGDLGFCTDEEAIVQIVSSHQELRWDDGGTQRERFLSQAGLLHLVGIDHNGCQIDTQILILAYPDVGVEVQDLLDIDFESQINLPVSYSGDIDTYNWTPNVALSCVDCPFPSLLQALPGLYQIEVQSELGCTDVAQLRISFERTEIYLPNSISKNTSNFENRLLFAQSNSNVIYSLRVYNRWGDQEYEEDNIIANDASMGWMPGEEDFGVYVYYVNYVDENGQEQMVKGSITVLD